MDRSSAVCGITNSASKPTDLSEIAVLVAHSDPVISAGLVVLLRKSRKFKVLWSRASRSTSHAAMDLAHSADVVIADYDSGIGLIVGAPDWNGRVVIFTHRDSQAKICHALAQRVRGYLLLGCSLQDLVAGIRSVHAGGVALTPLVASRLAESLNQETLTAKEHRVLRQMTLGWSNKRIAGDLGVALGTVKSHAKSIFDKLDAGNRGEAVAIARRRGILPDEIDSQEPCGAKVLPRLAFHSEGSVPRNGAAVAPFFCIGRSKGKRGEGPHEPPPPATEI
jgi:DNA-binding NarL/FixJ family response regulator